MRILVVQESDYLERGPHLHHLFERLSSRGHQIRVIDYEILWRKKRGNSLVSARKKYVGIRRATESGGVTVIRPGMVRIPVLDYSSEAFTHLLEIQRQIKEFRPHIVVGLGIVNTNIAFRLAKRNRISTVFYLMDELHTLVPTKIFRGLAGALETSNVRLAQRVLAVNEALREYSIEKGARPEATQTITTGVDLKRYEQEDIKSRNEVRRDCGFEDDDIVMFFMGWLYDFSGLKEVVSELAREEWRTRKVKLLIVGSGDQRDSLRKTIVELGISDTVFLHDWVSYKDLPKYLHASDVCILPAILNETMRNIVPLKVYEYMASSKPVISTDLPGMITEFGSDSGVVFVNRPEEVVRVAFSLADRQTRTELGEKARKAVGKKDWVTITNEFEKCLGEVIRVNKSDTDTGEFNP